MKRSHLFALATLFFSLNSFAIIDMKNANFSHSWTDLEALGTGYDLKVTRTYNSRSLFNGMFGFGWCSDFETNLELTAEGNIKLTECGAGQKVFFLPKEFNKKDIEKTATAIVDKMIAQKVLEAKNAKTAKEELIGDSDKRAQYAMEYKVTVPIKEGMQFYANGKEVENIVYAKQLYTRNMPDGSSMRFNNQGRLTHMYDKNGNYLKFDYDKDSIKEISDNNGRKLNFKYYPNKKVKTIAGPNNLTAEYKFANVDDLSWVKNGWNNIYTFEYDDLHNLTKMNYPDKTFIAVTYDKKNDWVLSFADREKCLEKYTYEFSEDDPKNHYWSLVQKTCGKEVTNESKHEFWYKNRADGQVFLQRVASTVNGNLTDITYHETFGKPVILVRNNDRSIFDYYPNGLVKTKTNAFNKLNYEYDKQNSKVSVVITQVLNEKLKVLATKKTEFKYDPKGNLTYAQNSEGQKITMTYDPKGRIATITDQAKKLVKIDYEEKYGKPAVVSRPGLGTIKVTYKTNGEIDKVNSNEGPTVAMQVASTFNNLLDIISPATAEVFN